MSPNTKLFQLEDCRHSLVSTTSQLAQQYQMTNSGKYEIFFKTAML